MALKSFPLSINIIRFFMTPWRGSVRGKENLPQSGPYIVAANHSSYLDGALLAAEFAWVNFRPLHMISIEQPFRHWLWGWFLRSTQCIPLRKASREGTLHAVGLALAYLARGEQVGILPEGHVGGADRLRALRPGAALLALESGAPIVPVGIVGSRDVLPPGQKYLTPGRKADMIIGKPIRVEDESRQYRAGDIPARAALREALLERLGAELADLCGKRPPRRPRRRSEEQ